MRIRFVLFALVFLGCPSFSWGVPPVAPGIPSSQAPGQPCSVLGMSGMAHDHTTLVVCTLNNPDPYAADCASGCKWKSMSGGQEGLSYTAWGTVTCASGWSLAYTGVGLFPALGTIAPTTADPVCSAVTTGDSGGAWGTWTNSVTDGHVSLPCAVCVK
ncbi:MAG: hypothetical protein PHY92_04895 [Alphaproteobacteria bacterium]|nr:hypothetical protein [Alphaproteobacteria bacterium]